MHRPDDLIIWPCNTWCYRSELHKYNYRANDYIVVKAGSLFYPDGITIFEEDIDYCKIVRTRLLMLGLWKND